MAGFITPLPVMVEEELNAEDRKVYDALEAPKSIVVRYGYQKMVAELPYNGSDKPGCGSKMVVRTQRGTEMAEMLTTTCANSGCAKSVSRKDMLKYIENSGGKDFPFTEQGKILRVAEVADLNEQSRLDTKKPEVLRLARGFIAELDLKMKPVEAELLLGGERVIIYYSAEQWVDFRELVKMLAGELQTRIEMHQVNDREEARLVADYERCGQYCCCKNFLKVLKPVSMRSAKVQKATLDPQKISGRCGRLMCCLRYEDQTYETLRKLLPHRKTLVETEDGVGLVLGSQILTQLVLVKIGMSAPAAYPLENIRSLNKEESAEFRKSEQEEAERVEAAYARRSAGRSRDNSGNSGKPAVEDKGKRRRRPRSGGDKPQGGRPADAKVDGDKPVTQDAPGQGDNADKQALNEPVGEDGKPKRKKRRRRRRKRKPGEGEGGQNSGGGGSPDGPPSSPPGPPPPDAAG